ncbi:hypothetical protein DENSPDRAFT_696052 [Dentipellis sp. KUC8613]|nr:hypothetical protein DENSPDRAFT_696052 [Dentipellis sp. KUC8613]
MRCSDRTGGERKVGATSSAARLARLAPAVAPVHSPRHDFAARVPSQRARTMASASPPGPHSAPHRAPKNRDLGAGRARHRAALRPADDSVPCLQMLAVRTSSVYLQGPQQHGVAMPAHPASGVARDAWAQRVLCSSGRRASTATNFAAILYTTKITPPAAAPDLRIHPRPTICASRSNK